MPTQRIIVNAEVRAQFLELFETDKRWLCVVAHRRAGKTYASLQRLVIKALQFPRADGRFGYVAPFLKQARQVAWDYLVAFTKELPGAQVRESDLSVTLPNGVRIRLYGADNADALRGTYFDGVVIDEVADFRPFVWGEVLRPALADRKGWALFIGTPKGVNLFYEIWQNALRSDEWVAVMLRASETGLVDADELRQARETMSDNQYRQEFECDFQANADDVLVGIELVEQACQLHYQEPQYRDAPRIIGVDVARFGDDRSVIMRRQGLAAFAPKILPDVDNMELAAHVAGMIDTWQPDAVFVDAGRGEGVIDRLRQLGHSPIEINFGGKPLNPRYTNRRSEMWGEMAAWLKAGGAIPDDLQLKSDLVVVTYSFNAAGKMQLVPKDKLKERGLPSPDVADALALTFAQPVAPRRHGFGRLARQAEVLPAYNPFG
jgi:hypothetical protein